MSITNTTQTPNYKVVFPGQNGVLMSLHTDASGSGDVKVPNEEMWKHIGAFTDAAAIKEAGKLYLQVSAPNVIKAVHLEGQEVPTVVDNPVLGKRFPVVGKIDSVLVMGPMQTDCWRASAGLNRPEIRLLSWLSKEETKNQWITASTGGTNDIPLSNSPKSIDKSLLHGGPDNQKWSVEWNLSTYLWDLKLVKSGTDKKHYAALYANEDRLVYHPVESGPDTEKKVDLDPKNLLVFTNKATVPSGTAASGGVAAQQNSTQQTGAQTPVYKSGSETSSGTAASGVAAQQNTTQQTGAQTPADNSGSETWFAAVLFVLAIFAALIGWALTRFKTIRNFLTSIVFLGLIVLGLHEAGLF